jgi:hypothetical protein
MLRDCMDPWLESLRADWTQQCSVVSEMMNQFREGCEADLSRFVLAHLHQNMPHLLSRAEMPVRVCSDGRTAETFGRADIVCIDADQVVLIELKRHPLAACVVDGGAAGAFGGAAEGGSGALDRFIAEAQEHRGELAMIGMTWLRANNAEALCRRARAIDSAPLEQVHVLHSVLNSRMNVLWDVKRVLRFGNRVHVVRTGRGVVDAALEQAAHYAGSIRADGFHPAAGIDSKFRHVWSVAVCVFGETMVCEWNKC